MSSQKARPNIRASSSSDRSCTQSRQPKTSKASRPDAAVEAIRPSSAKSFTHRDPLRRYNVGTSRLCHRKAGQPNCSLCCQSMRPPWAAEPGRHSATPSSDGTRLVEPRPGEELSDAIVGLRETSTLSSSAAVTESWAPRHNLRSATTRPLTAISDEIGDCVYSISVPARRRRSALPIDKTATDHAQSSSLLQVICNSAMFD